MYKPNTDDLFEGILKKQYTYKQFGRRAFLPKQFRTTKRIAEHVIRICQGFKLSRESQLCLVNYYTSPLTSPACPFAPPDWNGKTIGKLIERLEKQKASPVNVNSFSFLEDVLKESDYEFYIGKDRRRYTVTLKEYKYVLKKITSIILRDLYGSHFVTYSYFCSTPAVYQEYRKVTGKSGRDRNKLAYIFAQLERHRLIHRTTNEKHVTVMQIGPENPYYMLKQVPDIPEEQLNEVPRKKILSEREAIILETKVMELEKDKAVEIANRKEVEAEKLSLLRKCDELEKETMKWKKEYDSAESSREMWASQCQTFLNFITADEKLAEQFHRYLDKQD